MAMFGGATDGRAVPTAGEVCKSFSVSGSKVLWSAIGKVKCTEGKPWLLKLLADRGKPGVRVVLTNGPKGFSLLRVRRLQRPTGRRLLLHGHAGVPEEWIPVAHLRL